MLKQRIITALILAPLAVWGIFGLATPAFSVFIGSIVAIGAWEWANLCGWATQWQRWTFAAVLTSVLYFAHSWPGDWVMFPALVWWFIAFVLILTYPKSSGTWASPWVRALMGFLILVPAWKGLVTLHGSVLTRGMALSGVWIILYVFCTVWAADVGAYFAGRAWGKAKLAPAVSPGKSWAGVYGGLAAVTVLSLVVAVAVGFNWHSGALLVIISLVTAMVSVIGDLCESMLKRQRGIKDSSQLLPGHGGVLDRVDSITAAVPVFAVLGLWSGLLA